jgi:NAD(P)H dehydrogenase (quinone)
VVVRVNDLTRNPTRPGTLLSGRTVVYQNLPTEQYVAGARGLRLPQKVAQVLAVAEAFDADNWFAGTGDDLARLLGHPTTPLRAALVNALLTPAA